MTRLYIRPLGKYMPTEIRGEAFRDLIITSDMEDFPRIIVERVRRFEFGGAEFRWTLNGDRHVRKIIPSAVLRLSNLEPRLLIDLDRHAAVHELIGTLWGYGRQKRKRGAP